MPSRILVTGGAGFIGSHLVDSLVRRQFDVTVFDNLSAGNLKNLQESLTAANCHFIEGDLKNSESIGKALQQVELVYHFAANPEVRDVDPTAHFSENQVATFNLLESMRITGARTIIFASTSTIYGEASVRPTPEDYGPLLPISTYGASKLACEAMVASYAYTYGLRGLILRLGNVIGARSNHGVIPDFLKKLKQNPDSLEVLGDGTQTKSYIHVADCISAIELVVRNFMGTDTRVDAYNVSSADQVSVLRIAEIVLEVAGVNARIKLTGGVDGGRGWMGDVKLMQLSNQKLRDLGWKEKYNSELAIKEAAKELTSQI
ncbi:MAG TPA: NAD-dependent epimerase/dehydratase family protein [Methylomirabilota bacterium]|nr:NAD-dependent epimerase/dehydratase family protein [Methylomirabilota bacterium]